MDIPLELLIHNPILVHILVGVARAVLGYAENCAEAKKFLPFEFKRLIATIFRVGAESFGLSAMGVPTGSALVLDMGLHAIKKKKAKKE